MRIIIIYFIFFGWINGNAQEITITIDDYNKSIKLYNEAREYLSLRENQQFAIALLDKAITINPSNSDFYYAKSELFNQINLLDSAANSIDTALSLAPEEPEYHEQAGNIYFKMRNFEKAQNFYQTAIEKSKDSEVEMNLSVTYFNLGNCYLQMKDYEMAIHHFTMSINIDSNFAAVYHNRAIARKNSLVHEFEFCNDFHKAVILGSDKSKKYIDHYCK